MTSLRYYHDLRQSMVTVSFNCSKCGCVEFHRDQEMAESCKNFYEGHFHCVKCDHEAGYYDDDFTITSDPVVIQQTLFNE